MAQSATRTFVKISLTDFMDELRRASFRKLIKLREAQQSREPLPETSTLPVQSAKR